MKYYVGIDVGATYTRIGLADSEGKLLDKVKFNTPSKGDEYTVAKKIYETIMDKYGGYLDKIEAVGIGTIGPLDLPNGIVVNAANAPIGTFYLAEPLIKWLKKPVYVLNDCVAAVWGEKHFGVGKDYENVVYVTLSTGVGGGVIVNNVLILGKLGNAHEIGHMVVDYKYGLPCGCGGRGHWESYSGGANIPRFARYIIEHEELTREEKESRLYKLYEKNSITTKDVYTLAKQGDPLAKRIVDEITRVNIAGFTNIINAYDPEIITVGGSVALYNEELVIKPIKEGLGAGLATKPPIITKTPLGEDIVLIGAITAAIKPPQTLLRLIKYL